MQSEGRVLTMLLERKQCCWCSFTSCVCVAKYSYVCTQEKSKVFLCSRLACAIQTKWRFIFVYFSCSFAAYCCVDLYHCMHSAGILLVFAAAASISHFCSFEYYMVRLCIISTHANNHLRSFNYIVVKQVGLELDTWGLRLCLGRVGIGRRLQQLQFQELQGEQFQGQKLILLDELKLIMKKWFSAHSNHSPNMEWFSFVFLSCGALQNSQVHQTGKRKYGQFFVASNRTGNDPNVNARVR